MSASFPTLAEVGLAQAEYERTPCFKCGAVTVATASVLCQAERDFTDEYSCDGAPNGDLSHDGDGYLCQETGQSIDQWVDEQLALDRAQDDLDRALADA